MIIKRGKPGQPLSMQRHCERLLARADDAAVRFVVELRFDTEQAGHPLVRQRLGRRLNPEFVRRVCNRFYVGRMAAELQRFFSLDPEPEQRHGAPGLGQWRNGKLRVARSIQKRGMLLRVGRFSHFESLSVDDLREGWNVQKKQPITGIGGTRALCQTRSGAMAPFGWLLLRPKDE